MYCLQDSTCSRAFLNKNYVIFFQCWGHSFFSSLLMIIFFILVSISPIDSRRTYLYTRVKRAAMRYLLFLLTTSCSWWWVCAIVRLNNRPVCTISAVMATWRTWRRLWTKRTTPSTPWILGRRNFPRRNLMTETNNYRLGDNTEFELLKSSRRVIVLTVITVMINLLKNNRAANSLFFCFLIVIYGFRGTRTQIHKRFCN